MTPPPPQPMMNGGKARGRQAVDKPLGRQKSFNAKPKSAIRGLCVEGGVLKG